MLLNKDFNLSKDFTPSLQSTTSFKAKLASLRPKVFRRNTKHTAPNSQEKLTLAEKALKRNQSKTEVQELSPVQRVQIRKSSSLYLKPGGSLQKSLGNDKLKLCLNSLDRRRASSHEQLGQFDLQEAIKSIEISPLWSQDLKNTDEYARPLPSYHQRANTQRLSGQFSGRNPAIYGPLSAREQSSTFLTSVQTRRRPQSRADRPMSKVSIYTERIESLLATCSDQMTDRQVTNRLLTCEERKLVARYSSLKSTIEPPEAFLEGYVIDQIAEFRREKPAFIYGREFKGRYVKLSNRLL